MRYRGFLQAGLAAAIVVSTAGLVSPVRAAKLKQIYAFCQLQGCADGLIPDGSLTADASGHMYGVTTHGGAAGAGSVFELAPNAKRTKWSFSTVHSFCVPNCETGVAPVDGIILDQQGNLYGQAYLGGRKDAGKVFELLPNKRHTSWKLKILYSFCRERACSDGMNPTGTLAYFGKSSGAPYDGVSPLYGVTGAGGIDNGGVVYALTPGADGWTFQTLYRFCSAAGCADGKSPNGLTVDASGNLFGTTYDGGVNAAGVAFELAAANRSQTDTWQEAVLYDFCKQARCADGAYPISDLLTDSQGGLIGTTYFGGYTHKRCVVGGKLGCGVVFRLSPEGGSWTESVLYTFCTKRACADGERPSGGVTMDDAGNLFGLTVYGGSTAGNDFGGGVVWELGQKHKTLYAFCPSGQCQDGIQPTGKLLRDSAGRYFGMTSSGGDAGGGTIFEITP